MNHSTMPERMRILTARLSPSSNDIWLEEDFELSLVDDEVDRVGVIDFDEVVSIRNSDIEVGVGIKDFHEATLKRQGHAFERGN